MVMWLRAGNVVLMKKSHPLSSALPSDCLLESGLHQRDKAPSEFLCEFSFEQSPQALELVISELEELPSFHGGSSQKIQFLPGSCTTSALNCAKSTEAMGRVNTHFL